MINVCSKTFNAHFFYRCLIIPRRSSDFSQVKNQEDENLILGNPTCVDIRRNFRSDRFIDTKFFLPNNKTLTYCYLLLKDLMRI